MKYRMRTNLMIDKNICLLCFNKIEQNTIHFLLNKELCICQKCLDEMEPILQRGKIENIKGIYIYFYNQKLKEKIYTFKGCFDYQLYKAFLNYFLIDLKIKFKGYEIICAPSAQNKDEERGYNHVYEIATTLELPIINYLIKVNEYKQAKLKVKDRKKTNESIDVVLDPPILKNKKILFIDDIYTTGETSKRCLNLIKKANPKKLKFLIICKVKNTRNIQII